MKVAITMDLNDTGRMSNLCVDGKLINLEPIHFEEGMEYVKSALYHLLTSYKSEKS